ncbi:MAG TPA: hypothetical protein VMT18_05505 [Planctomycetota bacterium]|nr:hypothetical protein [Planctomycetota bacterium]
MPALGAALVLAVLSGATPVSCYASTFEHEPRVEPPEGVDVERRPIVTTVWTSGPLAPAIDALGLEPDLYLRFRRLDWSGTGWTPLWKSGTLVYAVEAQLFGGAAKGGCELFFEGELHATFRGLCSPDEAREELTEILREHVQTEVRERVGS